MDNLSFKIKKNIYSKSVLLRSCSFFIDDHYIYLDLSKDHWIIEVKTNTGEIDSDIEGKFKNILVSEAFKESLSNETINIKEMIVARALYSADTYNNFINRNEILKDNKEKKDYSFLEKEIENYKEDPLGISLPWEIKHKKENKET